LYYGNGGCCN